MKRILATNDDGIAAEGLRALERALAALGEVYTVAPREERSAASQSISLRRALSYERVEERRWAVDGTPADSVILALHHLLDFRPDLVVSGINHGGNLGKNVHYSGTVGAAAEAVQNGIPAIAISLCGRAEFDFTAAADFSGKLVAQVLERGLPPGVLLNVNVPRRWKQTSAQALAGAGQRLHAGSGGVCTTRTYCHLARTGVAEADGLRIREQVDFDHAPPDSDYTAIRAGSVSVSALAVCPWEETTHWQWEP